MASPTHSQPHSPPPPTSLSVVRRTSKASSLQDAEESIPESSPLSLTRKDSEASSLGDTMNFPNFTSNPPAWRRNSSISTQVSFPNPLRIFKRQSRKAFLEVERRHPLLKLSKAEASLSPIAQPRVTAIISLYDSLERHVARGDPATRRNSPNASAGSSDEEGHGTDTRSRISTKKPSTRKTVDEDEGSETEFQQDLDLKHPTRVRRQISATPARGRPGPFPMHCALCRRALEGRLQTYAFPQTAPAVISAITALHPSLAPLAVDLSLSNSTPPEHPPQPIQHKSPLPFFCQPCFSSLRALHLCWTCGLQIPRQEEQVAYGWAWWHWGCLSCLLCRAPVAPPAWREARITLPELPVCSACLREVGGLEGRRRPRRRLGGGGLGFDGSRGGEEEEEEEEVEVVVGVVWEWRRLLGLGVVVVLVVVVVVVVVAVVGACAVLLPHGLASDGLSM